MTCSHSTPCPTADASDALAAHVVADHSEQGWSLLCNGMIVFDDGGWLSPAASRRHTPAAA